MNMRVPPKNALYGLVLTGGKSTRMKADKAALTYHGKPQSAVCFELLSEFCEKVFISNRADQADAPGNKGFPQIHDGEEFSGKGPLAGILSAMQAYPNAAWLVLACDLPYVDSPTVKYLFGHRDPKKIATAYRSAHDGLPEPLCAVYEVQAQPVLLKFFHGGTLCPRKILINSATHLLEPQNPTALENINDPEEYQKAKDVLNQK